MNAKSIIASISLLVATGAAFAATPSDQSEAAQDQAFLASTSSTLSRAEVKADTIAAIKAGVTNRNEAYDDIAYQAPNAKTPSVKAQLASKSVNGTSAH